ncbi:MAG TPA: mechanosensitive ion channel family protein [Myxococcota bacterium]|nr:mechanosensitive ion channel family protein [Myxococcota bacterium]
MWATLAAQIHSRPLERAFLIFSRIDTDDWLVLAALAAVAIVAAFALTSLVVRVLAAMAKRSVTMLDDRFVALATGPLRLCIAVLLFSLGRRLIDLSPATETVFGRIESALFIGAAFWHLLRLFDLLGDDYRRRFLRRGQGQASAILGLVQRLAKLAAIGIAVITVLDNAGVHVTALLAGVGLGGIAIALAAQKSLENLFGGLTLYLDRPVRVGSFCRFGDRIGEIEEIGLRSTRVRTPERTLVTVPNGEFANMQLESFGSQDKIWFHPTLAIRSNTPPERVRGILAALRETLAKHPRIEHGTARVRVGGFGSFSINLDLSAYVQTSSLDEYFAIAEELHLAVLDVLAEHGSGIAFNAPPEFK